MANFKVDNIQVGSINDAISENIDGELIFKDSTLPQGVSLANLVSDASFAQQIQDNTDAHVESVLTTATTQLSASFDAFNVVNTETIAALSGDLYNGNYESYLQNQGILSQTVGLNKVNNFTQSIGINKPIPETQLHIKNNEVENDFETIFTLENRYPDNLGSPSIFNTFSSQIKQIGNVLRIINKTNGTIELFTDNADDKKLTISPNSITTNMTNRISSVLVLGEGQVQTPNGGSSLISLLPGANIDPMMIGAVVTINGQERIVETKTNVDFTVLSISGQDTHSVDTNDAPSSFSYRNPFIDTPDSVLNANGFLGLGNKTPLVRLQISDENAILLDDHNPKMFFGHKEDTYGVIDYTFTSDPISKEGFDLKLGSKKLGEGASVRISSVSDNSSVNQTPSGEIEFYTSKYEYETINQEEQRVVINTFGNMGVNNPKPISKFHLKQQSDEVLTGTISVENGSTIISGSQQSDDDEHETMFTYQVGEGDIITYNGQTKTVVEVIDDFHVRVDTPIVSGAVNERATISPNIMRVDNSEDGTVMRIAHDGALVFSGDISGGVYHGDGRHIQNLGGLKNYSTVIGDGSSNPIIINHFLNSLDTQVTVRDTFTNENVLVDTKAISPDHIQFTFTTPPISGQYSVKVLV